MNARLLGMVVHQMTLQLTRDHIMLQLFINRYYFYRNSKSDPLM